VRHDKSGRAIWEWAVDTGRHALDSTSRLLKRLEVPGLSVADEAKKAAASAMQKKPTFGGPAVEDSAAGKRQSFNPYDSHRPPPRSASPRPAARTPMRATPPAPAPGFLSRLFGAKR
jgi:hypothetical protein